MRRVRLGDCLTMIRNGANISQKKGAKGLPITRIETLSNDKFNRDRLGYADIWDIKQYSDYILDDDDILMSHINSREFLGRCVLYKKRGNEKIIHGMNLLRLKTNRGLLDPYYAYYFFQTKFFKKNIQRIRKDAINQSSIAISDIVNIEIDLPLLEEQKKIANVLKIIDNSIDLDNQINAELETIAKTIYDYWFVQFDFPDKDGKPYKSSGGKMVWDETLKREIPEGWNVVPLSSYMDTFVEKVSPENVTAKDKYAPIEVLPRRKMSFNACAPIEEAVSSLCRFQKKNILLSNRRVYFHKVCIAAFGGITRDTVIVMKPYSEKLLGYAYQLVNDDAFIKYATLNSYGTEQPVLSWESAKTYNVLKPSNYIDEVYSKKMESLIDAVLMYENEINALLKLRNELLPLLMNGQVSIKD